MEWLIRFLLQQPLHILGVAVALGIVWALVKPRVRSLRVAALAWLAYAGWEWVVLAQTPEANIRVDLLVLWPLLAILTLWAFIKTALAILTRKSSVG